MAELIWDFYRKGASDEETQVGALLHYYDQSSQSIFVKNALYSRESEPQQGQWETAKVSEAHKITSDRYDQMAADHASNGVWYGSATDGDDLYLLRYMYAKDLSDYAEQATWEVKNDNQIKQITATIQNMDEGTFRSENTLFHPNAKLKLYLSAGDSEPYEIGTAYMDDIDYDLYSETVPISGRNIVGAMLNDQTFGINNEFNGLSSDLFKQILELAGIKDYAIQTGSHSRAWKFEYDQTILSGLQEMLEYYYEWKLVESPEGKILIGGPKFISDYVKNSDYVFNGGSEVFSRKTSKNIDAAYTHVCVKCADTKKVTDDDGNETTEELYPPVVLPVPTFSGWELPANKTYHATASAGMTESEIRELAEELVRQLQYTGVVETFVSPIRPWILTGDIARIYYKGDTESTSLGLITSVKHTLGTSGYKTEFTIDSGGTATEEDAFSATTNRPLNGYTRKQVLTDIIKIISRNIGTNKK